MGGRGGLNVKAGGSLPRGRRLPNEVPDVPSAETLTGVERAAQAVLRPMVERAGGRFSSRTPIAVEHVEDLAALFNEWAHRYGRAGDRGIRFSGRPGLWHALDVLYPLEDPNRWDRLREAIIGELESKSWRRVTPPRGSAFDLLD